MAKKTLGEFEQRVLLAVVEMAEQAHALDVSRLIVRQAGRPVSRGALYTTFDRLEEKGYLEWKIDVSTPSRRGVPRRRFTVTDRGLEVLRSCREELAGRLEAFDDVLGSRT